MRYRGIKEEDKKGGESEKEKRKTWVTFSYFLPNMSERITRKDKSLYKCTGNRIRLVYHPKMRDTREQKLES